MKPPGVGGKRPSRQPYGQAAKSSPLAKAWVRIPLWLLVRSEFDALPVLTLTRQFRSHDPESMAVIVEIARLLFSMRRAYASLAQLVEHRSCKAKVAGSIPAGGSFCLVCQRRFAILLIRSRLGVMLHHRVGPFFSVMQVSLVALGSLRWGTLSKASHTGLHVLRERPIIARSV